MKDMMKWMEIEIDGLNEKIEKLEADLALWDGREEVLKVGVQEYVRDREALCNLIDDKDKRIAKLREYLDTCEAAYERDMAERDTEIDRLRAGVKAIADHQLTIGGHMATMGSVYVMATRLIEKNERG